MKKLLIISLAILFLVAKGYGQTCRYEVVYNPTTCLYEAHMHVITSYTDPLDVYLGTSAFSIVIPAVYADAAIPQASIISVNPLGAVWTDNTPVFAPSAAPGSDFHKFATSGAQFNNGTNLTAGADILLFTFPLTTTTCAGGIRNFINWSWIPAQTNPDPSSSAAGMQGGDFRNSCQTLVTGESYIGNVGTGSALPIPTVTADFSLTCSNPNTLNLLSSGNSTLGCNNSLTYSWTGTGSYSSTSQNPVISSFTAPGTFTVVVKDYNGCTSAGSSVTISSNPSVPAAPTASATLQPSCTVATGTITVTAPTGTGMTYSIDGSTYTNTTGIFTLVAAGTYPVTARSSAGCTSPATSVTVNPQPATPAAPTASVTLQPTCTVATGTITVTAPTGTGMTYSINGSTYTNTTGIFTLVPAGTYSVTARSAAGCTSTVTSVTVNPQPATPAAPTASVTLQPTCTVPTGTITVTAPTGTGITYSIDNTNYTNTTGVFTLVTPGTYSVTAKNASGCISTGTSVTVNAAPASPAAPTASVTLQPSCTVATGTITVTAPTGAGMTYSIDGSTYTNTSGVFTLVAAGTYNVTARSSAGCTSTATSVTVNPQPATPAAPTASVTLQPTCTVATGTITVTAPTGSGMTYSINGSTYTNTTGVFTLVAAGTYSVTARNSAGCTSTATSVTVNTQPATPAAPTASVTLQPTCTVPTGTITVTAPTGTGMTYSIDNTIYSNTTGVFTLVPAGTYNVTAKNSAGCISSGTSVTVNPPPGSPAAPTASVTLQPTCTVATGTITVTAPTGTGMTYSIDGTTYTNTTGVFTLVPAGTYNVTARNSAGCTSTATSVTVNPQPATPAAPTASVTLQPTCTVATGTITVTAPTGTGMTYSINGSTYTNTTGIFTLVAAGTYNVTAKNSAGCTSLVTSVTVNPQPATPAAPTASVTLQPTCTVPTGTITVTAPTGTGMTYSIDGSTYTNTTGIFTLVPAGTYSVTAKNAAGCISTGTSITVNPSPGSPAAPTASVTLQPTCTVATGTITVTAPTGTGMTYSIDGSTYTNTTGVFTLVTAGTYSVTARNVSGCTSPATSVTVNAQPATPAAPTASITLQPTCSVPTGTITVTAPTGSGMTYSINGSTYTNTTGVFTLVPVGTYSVTARNTAGCTSSATSISITAPQCQTDLAVVKTVNTSSPSIGSNVTFTITATNNGPITSTGIVVNDVLPAGYTFVSATPSMGSWSAPNWNIGSLNNGGSATLQMVATVNASGPYLNTATIAGNLTDPVPGNNSSNASVTVGTPADLQVVKTVSNATPLLGSNVTFLISATNLGPNNATGVVVNDILPSGYTFVEAAPTIGTWSAPKWTIGNLGVGVVANLSITAKVLATGNYLNTATISGNQSDPVAANNTSSASVTLAPVADLQVVKTVSNSNPAIGTNVTFTITAKNNGPVNATGVVVNDMLPAGLTFVSATPSAGSWASPVWTIGNLNVGSSVTMTLVAKVNADGNNSNTAIISGTLPDLVATNNSSTVTVYTGSVADMAITKTVNVMAAYIGSNVTFSLEVTNNGPIRAMNIIVTDILPPGFTLVSAIPSMGDWNSPKWNIVTLNPGNSATMTIVAKVNASGSYKNTATVTSDQPDPDPGNNTASAEILNVYDSKIAINEYIGMCQQVSVSGNILANGDRDPAGGTIIVNTTPVSGPSHGSYILQKNGDFTYIPDVAFSGKDMVVNKLCAPGICGMDTVFFYVNLGLDADAGPDIDLCNSSTAVLNGNQIVFAKGTWSQVSGPSTASITGSSTSTATVSDLRTGTYRFRYQLSLASCIDADTVNVTVWTPPVAYAGSDATMCSGNEYVIRDATAGNYSSLLWTHNGSGTISGKNTLTPVYSAGINETGDVTLTLTAFPKGKDGCQQAVDKVVLTVMKKPQIICPKQTNYTFIATSGYCGYLVRDSVLDAKAMGSKINEITMNHDFFTWGNSHTLRGAVLPVGTTQIQWWANTYGVACSSDTCTIVVTVLDNVPPEFLNCPSGKEFTIGLSGGDCTGGATWSIPVAKDNCSEVTVKQISGPELGSKLEVGRYTITYVATDASGNKATCTFYLNVVNSTQPLLSCPQFVTMPSDPGLCTWASPLRSLSPLLANNNCPYTIGWEVTNPNGTVKTGDNDVSGYVFQIGTSIVKYTLKDKVSGQTLVCTFNVTVVDSEAPVISCPVAISEETIQGKCEKEVKLVLPSYKDGCNSPVKIAWSVIGPDNSYKGPFPGTQLTYNFHVGMSQVIWTLTDDAGNRSDCIQEIRITASNKDILAYAGKDSTICEKTGYKIMDNSIAHYDRLLWSSSGTGAFSDPASLHPTYTPSTADVVNKQVILTLTAFTECANATDHMILTISPYPKLSAGPDLSACYSDLIPITQAAVEYIGSVKWVTTGKGELTGNTMLQPVYKPAKGETGEVKFILSGKGQSGCGSVELKDTLKVNIHNPLQVIASKDISILKNTSTILSVLANNGSGLYKYSWEPANLVVNPNVNSTTTQALLSNTSFLITVTDAQWGCTGKDTVNVTVKESVDDLLTIYNAISPNGDGLNDIWYIDGIELFPDNEVMIFNRWGDKISEHVGYDNNRVFWDGTNSHGKRVPDGTYYYVLKIKNLKTYTGWIQVKSSL